jgi:hypothetical protein
MLQSDPTGQLAFEALNKDPAFFMGNRDAITQAVGGDLGAWRNARDSASSNRRQLTPEELTQIASFGSPGGGAAPGAAPGMNYAGGSSGFNESARPGGEMNYTGGSGSFNEGSNLAGGYQPIGGESRNTLGAIGGNIPLDIGKFLDPATGFRIGEATKAVENSAAARGGLLSGSTLRGVSDRANQVAGDEYARATDRAFADRGFTYGVDRDDRDFAYRANTGDRDFNYARERDNRDTEIGLRRDDRNFNFDRERYNNDFAYRAAVDARNYERDSYRDDRDFGYRAETGDRDFNEARQRFLTDAGLRATGQQTDLQRELARILNANTLTAGGANAAGTSGQSAATNDMISQIIKLLTGNSIVSGLPNP